MLKKITLLAVMMMSLAAMVGSAKDGPTPPCWPCTVK